MESATGISRREFLSRMAAIGGAAVIGSPSKSFALDDFPGYKNRYGVLVDTTLCIGCRRCEWACNEWNKLPNKPIKSFEDKTVFEKIRRTHADAFTVVNRYIGSRDLKPVYVKKQCMHCEEPACVSACFVKAFRKTPEAAVVYDASVCVGCRYCMIVCPFDIPAYEYNEPITPRVLKCTFCFDRIGKEGGVPACVEICPTETLRFGKRSELIELAYERISNKPRKYVNHVYGEHEVGGTSWLYLSADPFEEIGFRTDLGKTPIPKLGKTFLTAVSAVLVSWPVLFTGLYAFSKMRGKHAQETGMFEKKKAGEHGQET